MVLNKNVKIEISIVDDKTIKSLNKKYLKRDYTTDVLSFNIDEKLSDGTYLLGEVVVNREQAVRQAEEYGNDVKHEIAELVEHGVLHLLGVHHPDDDDKSVHGIKI